MNRVGYFLVNVVETLLRMVPVPCRTGLVRIGNPDRNSPVLVTGNYHLTVTRVRHAIRGLDCWLLVANSRGVNVWCAATGGLLTTHAVISVIKTSGIENHVDHRRVILPQLIATGIESGVITAKTGWTVYWGPVYARDIPAYLTTRPSRKNPLHKLVTFPVRERLEMAVAWSFPISILGILILMWFWPAAIFPMTLMVWGLALLIYLAFPLYQHHLRTGNKLPGPFGLEFGRGGIPIILGIPALAILVALKAWNGHLSWGSLLAWGILCLVVIVLLSLDLAGSTPVYKSGLQADRFLKIRVDKQRCRGAGFCAQVCPRGCYEVDSQRHTVTQPPGDRCVQCGACIVQCPFDALSFLDPGGNIIPPETVRKYKLNLWGGRVPVS